MLNWCIVACTRLEGKMKCLENLSLENDSISVNICVLMLNQIRTYICLVIEMFVLFLYIYAYYTCTHIHYRGYSINAIIIFIVTNG